MITFIYSLNDNCRWPSFVLSVACCCYEFEMKSGRQIRRIFERPKRSFGENAPGWQFAPTKASMSLPLPLACARWGPQVTSKLIWPDLVKRGERMCPVSWSEQVLLRNEDLYIKCILMRFESLQEGNPTPVFFWISPSKSLTVHDNDWFWIEFR